MTYWSDVQWAATEFAMVWLGVDAVAVFVRIDGAGSLGKLPAGG